MPIPVTDIAPGASSTSVSVIVTVMLSLPPLPSSAVTVTA